MKNAMIKILILLTLSLTSINIFAQPPTVQPIPSEELSIYKNAASLAIKAGNFICNSNPYLTSYIRLTTDFIADASLGERNSDGAQPLLIFTDENENETKEVYSLVTSVDYKSIISINYAYFEMKDVNVGNLNAPHIVREYVQITSSHCTNIAPM